MWKTFALIQKRLALSITIAMALGIGIGLIWDTTSLNGLILPLTILMIYPMMVTLDFRALLIHCRPRSQAIIQGFNLVLIPLLGFGIGLIFFRGEPYLAYGLLLIAFLPTSGMTISWTGFAKGDVKLAVKTTVFGLLIGALLMPFYSKLFMGEIILFPLTQAFIQIGKIIIIPLVLGIITQWLLKKKLGKNFTEIKGRFPLISTLGVLGMIMVALSLKAKSLVSDPLLILRIAVPVLLFYIVNYTVVTFFGRMLLPRAESIAVVYGTVMRNLSVALALALTIFKENGAEIALVIAIAFIFQVQSAAWYIKASKKFFLKT